MSEDFQIERESITQESKRVKDNLLSVCLLLKIDFFFVKFARAYVPPKKIVYLISKGIRRSSSAIESNSER